MVFGVSPAWFLSLYGEHFTVAQAADSLGMLADLGFRNWQPEIFHIDAIDEWRSGKDRDLLIRSRDLGLYTDVFVAHFLGDGFIDRHGLENPGGTAQFNTVLDALERWDGVSVVVLPLPPWRDSVSATAGICDIAADRLIEYSALVRGTGRRLAFEPMPGNLFGRSERIARLLSRPGLETAGVNYDSGHFHAAGENIDKVFAGLGDRILCTHLCDNDGIENLSLAPGDGTLDWVKAVRGLIDCRYTGSWDIEIRCPSGEVKEAYRRGRSHIERILLKESA